MEKSEKSKKIVITYSTRWFINFSHESATIHWVKRDSFWMPRKMNYVRRLATIYTHLCVAATLDKRRKVKPSHTINTKWNYMAHCRWLVCVCVCKMTYLLSHEQNSMLVYQSMNKGPVTTISWAANFIPNAHKNLPQNRLNHRNFWHGTLIILQSYY